MLLTVLERSDEIPEPCIRWVSAAAEKVASGSLLKRARRGADQRRIESRISRILI
jgi:hypothetical protein